MEKLFEIPSTKKPKKIKKSKKWISRVQEKYNMTIVQTVPTNSLFITKCTNEKNLIPQGIKVTPAELYTGNTIKTFFTYCINNKIPYGILSDKYGLLLPDSKIEWYDLHPWDVTDSYFENLGEIVNKQCNELNITNLCFFGSSPILSTPYFKILKASKIHTSYITKLPLGNINNAIFTIIYTNDGFISQYDILNKLITIFPDKSKESIFKSISIQILGTCRPTKMERERGITFEIIKKNNIKFFKLLNII